MRTVWVAGIAAALATAPAMLAQQGAGAGAGQGSGQARARSAAIVMKEVSFLGIGGVDVDPSRARALKLRDEHGTEITSVLPDSPAEKAGLKVGDVVLEFNGQRVEDWEQLVHMVRDTPSGKQVKLSLWRSGAPLTLTATVGSHKVMESDGGFSFEMPAMPPIPMVPNVPNFKMPPIDVPRMITVMRNQTLGIEGESLGQEPQFAEFFGVKDGVLVKSVIKGSAGERGGLKAGDVIAKVGDTHIASWRDIAMALRHAGETVPVTVMRAKKEVTLSVVCE